MTTDTSLDDDPSSGIVATARDAVTLYPETVIAVALAPFYGVTALAPIIEVALVDHGRWTPFFLGVLFSLIIPILFRVWQSRYHAHRAVAFSLVATPLTWLLYYRTFDPIPRVRGQLLPIVDVALVALGGAGIALAVTWYVTGEPDAA